MPTCGRRSPGRTGARSSSAAAAASAPSTFAPSPRSGRTGRPPSSFHGIEVYKRGWCPLVRVRLLGPVDILTNNVPQQLSGIRRKAVLAALALHGSEVVSAGRLTEIVWGNAAPAGAANTLQSHVSHLRS